MFFENSSLGLTLMIIASIVCPYITSESAFMTTDPQWQLCPSPKKGDTLKWNEPLWAAPNKPRGKRDKIGEQEIIAELISMDDVLELKVMSVKKLTGDDVRLSVQENDQIKRKQSSLEKGACHKLLNA